MKSLNNQINILRLKLFCMKVYYFISGGPSGLNYGIGGRGMSAYGITLITMKMHYGFSRNSFLCSVAFSLYRLWLISRSVHGS